ncbi:quinon protein alcohol dehydrogenase-like superfamily [Limtongia smithiae]|uniref:quinon protein alcohol dehydrogenase-like superfamily n=1 Tax=Limtongia smithiae TaxID=1125753 RepID=UPI0034CE681B
MSAPSLDDDEPCAAHPHGHAHVQAPPAATTAAAMAPFLTRHIPERLYPESHKESRTFCYRHHPDFKCKRQADETNMEDLQHELDLLPKDDQQAISHVWSIFSAAPANERNLILKGVLSQCCSPQLSYVSSMLRDLIRIDFVSALPSEISFKILCYLDASSLCQAAQVSRKWRQLADDDVVWHRMCEQHIERKCTKCGWGLPLLERRRLRQSKKVIEQRIESISAAAAAAVADAAAQDASVDPESPVVDGAAGSPSDAIQDAGISPVLTTAQLSDSSISAKRSANSASDDEQLAESSSLSASSSSSTSSCHLSKRVRLTMPGLASQNVPTGRLTRPWKDVYSERLKVEQNWRRGRYQLKIFRGHTDGVMCLQFDETTLITGSYDTTVRVWDIETGKLLRILTGHVRGVRALRFDDGKLVTGSMDCTIKVWDYRTGDCVSTLRGHTDGVLSLHYDGSLLASGSADKTIRVWNFQDKSFFTLRGHTDWVNSVFIHGATRTLFSASDDTTARMWDLDTRQCVRVFGNTTPGMLNGQGHFGQVQCVIPVLAEEEEEAGGEEAGGSEKGENYYHQPVPPSGSFTEAATGAGAISKAPELSPSITHATLPGSRQRRMKSLPTVITSSLDNTSKFWNTSTGECTRTLFGHVEGVWGLAADTFRVVTGAHDRLVKVWDIHTGRCLHTYSGHSAPVACVGLSDSRLASGSDDGEVRVYSFGVD